jgi:hypothetical protein
MGWPLQHLENVPNIDGQWNTYRLPVPIDAPNGFFVGIGYAGFLGLAQDTEWITDEYFEKAQSMDYRFYEFSEIYAMDGNGYHFLIRAKGITDNATRSTSLENNTVSSGYHIFRGKASDTFAKYTQLNSALLENPVYDDEGFGALPDGNYKYAVVSVYAEGVESEPVYSNTVIRSHTDINMLSEEVLRVYPNPASEQVFIKGAEVIDVAVYNTTGQMVGQITAKEGKMVDKINVSAYKQGVYLFKLTFKDKSTVTKRIMIAH